MRCGICGALVGHCRCWNGRPREEEGVSTAVFVIASMFGAIILVLIALALDSGSS